ncbi:MAG: hypothetical protein Q8934_17140 [Bacillota bacterium]|nr:hypothetical protein [Bacillota bacterium]
MGILLPIVLLLVGLFLLYAVIEAAVKNGINKSVVGELFDKKNGFKEDKESFLDRDLDNDK